MSGLLDLLYSTSLFRAFNLTYSWKLKREMRQTFCTICLLLRQLCTVSTVFSFGHVIITHGRINWEMSRLYYARRRVRRVSWVNRKSRQPLIITMSAKAFLSWETPGSIENRSENYYAILPKTVWGEMGFLAALPLEVSLKWLIEEKVPLPLLMMELEIAGKTSESSLRQSKYCWLCLNSLLLVPPTGSKIQIVLRNILAKS